jgi:hypothetical protein
MNSVLIESCNEYIYESITFTNIDEAILSTIFDFKYIIQQIKHFFAKVKSWIIKLWNYLKRLFMKNKSKEEQIKELVKQLKVEYNIADTTPDLEVLKRVYTRLSNNNDVSLYNINEYNLSEWRLFSNAAYYFINILGIGAAENELVDAIDKGESEYIERLRIAKDLLDKLKDNKFIIISDHNFDSVKELVDRKDEIIKRMEVDNKLAENNLNDFMKKDYSDELKNRVFKSATAKMTEYNNLVTELFKYMNPTKIYNDTTQFLSDAILKMKRREDFKL